MKLLLSILVLSSFFVSTSAEAQRRRPRHEPRHEPRNERMNVACFYENDFYQGRSFCLRRGQSVVNLSSTGFNDRISSARIPRGMSVTVFQDSFFRGSSLRLSGDVMSISRYGRFWNDKVSSILFR